MALGVRTIVVKAIQLPVQIYVAAVLGPQSFGLLRLINMIPSLAKFGVLNYGSVTVREIADHVDENGELKPTLSRNVAYSSTLILSVCLSVAVSVASLLIFDGIVAIAACLTAFTLSAVSLLQLLLTNARLVKDFRLIAFAETSQGVIEAIVSVVLIGAIGIFAPLIAALASASVVIVILVLRRGLGFALQFDRRELVRQTRIAAPLTLVTLVFGAVGWTERAVVGWLGGLEVLGLYSISMLALENGSIAIRIALQAISVHLYERFSGAANEGDFERFVLDPTAVAATISPIAATMLWIWLDPLLGAFLPAYRALSDVTGIVAVNLWLSITPSILLAVVLTRQIDAQYPLIAIRTGEIALFGCACILLWSIMPPLEAATIARGISLAWVLVTSLALSFSRMRMKSSQAIQTLAVLIAPMVWAIICVLLCNWLLPGIGWLDATLKTILFAVFYSPVLLMMERRLRPFATAAEIIVSSYRGPKRPHLP